MLRRFCSSGLRRFVVVGVLVSACGARSELLSGGRSHGHVSKGTGGSGQQAATAGQAGSPSVAGHGSVAGASSITGTAGASVSAGGRLSGEAGDPGVVGGADGGSAESGGQGGEAGSNAAGAGGEASAPPLAASISQGSENACATVNHCMFSGASAPPRRSGKM